MTNESTTIDHIIEGYLHEIEYYEESLLAIAGNTKSLVEMADPALAKAMNLSDPEQKKELALGIIKRLLESGKVIAVDERICVKTDVWDFDTAKVIDLLSRNWSLAHTAPLKGHHNIFFFSKPDIHRLGEFHSKPVTFLKSPPEEL